MILRTIGPAIPRPTPAEEYKFHRLAEGSLPSYSVGISVKLLL